MKYLWVIHLNFNCLQDHLAISVLYRGVNGGLQKKSVHNNIVLGAAGGQIFSTIRRKAVL